MKAIVYTQYGSPDVLMLREIKKPVPAEHEILVKIHAASVNPLDWHTMRGEPFIARLSSGLMKPKHPQLGADFAGIVEAVGTSTSRFQPGDAVFGYAEPVLGSLAEYVCVDENAATHKPENITFEEVAVVPIAGLTALQAVRDHAKIQAGQSVLINGAAGGVGTFAVQIAKHFGAEVTGVCSSGNVEMVRAIGADHVIDYRKEDFSQSGKHYDVLIDNVGNYPVSAIKRVLTSGGVGVIVGFTSLPLLFQGMFLGPVISLFGDFKIFSMGVAQPNQDDLVVLKQLLESNKIKSVIDRRYLLSQSAEAIRYLETGHARSKVVINVEEE